MSLKHREIDSISSQEVNPSVSTNDWNSSFTE